MANLAYMMGWHPTPFLDTTPLAFIFTGILTAVGLFHFGLLDIMPVAKAMVIESIPEGIIVLDRQNRILDMNSAALKMTGLKLNQSIGQLATILPSDLLAKTENLLTSQVGYAEIYLKDKSVERKEEGKRDYRCYSLNLSPVYARGQDLKARILVIKISPLKRRLKLL